MDQRNKPPPWAQAGTEKYLMLRYDSYLHLGTDQCNSYLTAPCGDSSKIKKMD